MGEGAGGLAHLLSTAEHGVRSSDDEEIIVLTQVSENKEGCTLCRGPYDQAGLARGSLLRAVLR